MRTTINLDDDVFPAVKNYAESRSVSIGKAVSDLVRKGINASLPTRMVNGVPVFVLPPGSPPITSKRVRELQDDEQ
ncbi:MAG TPA: CopG family transcriptional regulator [Candidatus Angelobacter sp.]|jgi:hypothetical protein|nr:CopG family transcriptional regulator [Candidatus Angelobacter sp.]